MEQELGRERLGWKNVGWLGLKGKVAGGALKVFMNFVCNVH